MSARVGVVLSGCGGQDGTDTHQAVSVMIALDRRGAQIICLAPSGKQKSVINHLAGDPEPADRDMLVEASRIARGRIRDVASVTANDLDCLVFPGGLGAVKSLCNFAEAGPHCTVHAQIRRLVLEMHKAAKPIGMTYIASVLVARILGEAQVKAKVTIGTDRAIADGIRRMGAVHVESPPSGVVVDEENRLVSTPGYMNDVGPWVVYQGAEKMVEELLKLSGDPDSLHRQQMATLP